MDENWIFQFLSNFTEIVMVSLILKSQFYDASLWKAGKICNIWGADFVKICKKLTEI